MCGDGGPTPAGTPRRSKLLDMIGGEGVPIKLAGVPEYRGRLTWADCDSSEDGEYSGNELEGKGGGLDEVMSGMGRTGSLYACEQEGIPPDLICTAKGLGGGYQPIGATLVSDKIYQAFRDGPGAFQHGHTYLGHPIACAAALAVQKAIKSRGLLDAVKAQGAVFHQALVQRFGDHPHIGDIRGRGLFRGLELVQDRATKEPFDAGLKLHAKIKKEAFSRGLICYPDGGTVDGVRGDHVLLAPPYIVSESEIAEIVDKLGQAVDAAI